MAMPTGSYSGGAGGASGDSTAASSAASNSSWNVNFGSGGIDTGNAKMIQYVLIAAGVFIAWKLLRRGR